MAFTGKYEIESEKNYDEFMKHIGIPSETIEKGRNFKIISEVQQDGQNFTWSQHYPGGHSITNKFTIGKECDMETVGGKKFKATVQMEGGKLTVDSPNFHFSSEIVGRQAGGDIHGQGRDLRAREQEAGLSKQAGLRGGYRATNKAGIRTDVLLAPE
uniref:Cytosolic fatty-acid binding proteins domain-containing protein n=1 Tax=Equus asinus TaxID=9793 RepID=A0A8C4L0A0_EQUAS